MKIKKQNKKKPNLGVVAQPAIPAHGDRREEGHEFEAREGYTIRLCLKIIQQNK